MWRGTISEDGGDGAGGDRGYDEHGGEVEDG